MSTLEELINKSEKILAQLEKSESKSKPKPKPKSDLDQFLDWKYLDTKTQYKLVTDEIVRHWHFPTLVINNLLKHKSRLENELGMNEGLLMYFLCLHYFHC